VEFTRINNSLFQGFDVRGDTRHPLLDVTFDGRYIGSGDIVAPSPEIVIQLRDDNPVLVMESEQMYGNKGEVPDGDDFLIPIGKAEVVREGTDVTIITFGKMYHVVAQACDELAKEGISAEFIDLLSIRPLDYQTMIDSVRKTNRAVVVDESWPMFSVASEVAYGLQRYAFDHLDAPVVRVNGRDVPMAYASTLVAEYLPNPERVIAGILKVMR
jgi:pyruvate dehydrogenase E1 component beta subunit